MSEVTSDEECGGGWRECMSKQGVTVTGAVIVEFLYLWSSGRQVSLGFGMQVGVHQY